MLEIGCGTGQATRPLARLGARITAVELSAELAAVARRRLADVANVRIETAAFEDWALPDEPFDLVIAATAFHWIDPRIRVLKSADALRPGGTLAVISTHHVAGGSAAFFAEVQSCYERFDPATPPGLTLFPADAIPRGGGDFDDSGRFGRVAVRRYEWEEGYDTGSYLGLLATYSGHRALPAPARARLFGCIGDLIDRRHGGRITKRYLTELAAAARLP